MLVKKFQRIYQYQFWHRLNSFEMVDLWTPSLLAIWQGFTSNSK